MAPDDFTTPHTNPIGSVSPECALRERVVAVPRAQVAVAAAAATVAAAADEAFPLPLRHSAAAAAPVCAARCRSRRAAFSEASRAVGCRLEAQSPPAAALTEAARCLFAVTCRPPEAQAGCRCQSLPMGRRIAACRLPAAVAGQICLA